MRSHRLIIRRLRRLVLVLTAIALLVPAGATAVPTDNGGAQAREDQGYIHAITSLTQEEMAAAYATAVDAQSGVGDTQPKVGDTPADFPGASRAPDYQAPPTTDVVPPERTIVREANDALPIALASLALFIAIAMAGFVVVRMRGAVGRLP
jgi:hypothetical protein